MPFYKLILILCCIVGFVNLLKGRTLSPVFFFAFILYVTFFEVGVLIYLKYSKHNNRDAYNFFAITCIIYYLYVYYHYFKEQNFSKLIKWILILYSMTSFIHLYIINGKNQITSYLYLIGMSIVAVFCLRYIKEFIIRSNNNIFYDGTFYFSFGIVIFFTTSFPLIVFFDMLITHGDAMKAYSDLLKAGNIFLSLGYLGAALCIKKEV